VILRLTDKLARKVHEKELVTVPASKEPYADWSARMFRFRRTQYVMISNTASLYTAVIFGRGIVDGESLCRAAVAAIRDFCKEDGNEFIFQRRIAPVTGKIVFGKSLNRSVTGSLNDLQYMAEGYLEESDLSLLEVSRRVNTTPMSLLSMGCPRDAFRNPEGISRK